MSMITQIKTRKEQRKESRKKRKRHDRRRVEEPPPDVTPSKNKTPKSKPEISGKTKLAEQKDPASSEKEKVRKRKKAKKQESGVGNASVLYEAHPDLTKAIQRDEAEIAELEKRLGLTGRKKDKEKLYKEYSKLEGFGDDFGDFLDDLDDLVDRVRSTDDYQQGRNNVDGGSEMEDEEEEPLATTENRKKKRLKTEENQEDGISYDNLDPSVIEALRRDDEEIAALEKKLGLSKRKEKDKLYKEYSKLEGYGDDFGDFLDDLDGMMDRLKQPGNDYQHDDSGNASEGSNLNSDEGSEDEDEELVTMKGSSDEIDEDDSVLEELERMQREENESGQDHQDSNGNDEESGSEESSASGSDGTGGSDEKEDEIEPDHDIIDTYQPSKGEDIYGNKIDSEPSEGKKPSKYVPPHLRKKQQTVGDEEEEKERMRIISRSLNNSLNRLSEDTLISVAQQVAKLYSSNPTQTVHKLIWKNAKDVCIATPMLMTGLIPVYTACITGVHIQSGDTVQIGEYILENVVLELLDRLKESRGGSSRSDDDDEKEIENKQICNLMLVLCYLYNYSIVHCSFIYDIIRHLIKNFSEADVECLLILLSHCGRSLRSDDPTALKEIVLLVQKKKSESSKRLSSSRTEYMVSAIMDLKNNKRKREDTVFTEKISKFRKILGRVKASAAKMGLSKSTSEASLRITLNDIIQAETKGRWWKVGASWVGNQHRFSEDSKHESKRLDNDTPAPSPPNSEDGDEELLKLASKFRMNTDRKRAIFCIIMGGTDIEDTFEKLCRSSMLQNRTERDTVRVLMECCRNEKSYNKFYGHLAARICEFQPQSKFSLQLAYWDIFKQFGSIGARKGANLAKLLFHLVVTHRVLKILPVIKTLDLSDDDMDESTLIFLTILFSSILEHFSEPSQAKIIFTRSAMATKNGGSEEDTDEGVRAGLLVFFMETLKSSPRNKKNSRFRKNFKAIVKELDTDGFEDMF